MGFSRQEYRSGLPFPSPTYSYNHSHSQDTEHFHPLKALLHPLVTCPCPTPLVLPRGFLLPLFRVSQKWNHIVCNLLCLLSLSVFLRICRRCCITSGLFVCIAKLYSFIWMKYSLLYLLTWWQMFGLFPGLGCLDKSCYGYSRLVWTKVLVSLVIPRSIIAGLL